MSAQTGPIGQVRRCSTGMCPTGAIDAQPYLLQSTHAPNVHLVLLSNATILYCRYSLLASQCCLRSISCMMRYTQVT